MQASGAQHALEPSWGCYSIANVGLQMRANKSEVIGLSVRTERNIRNVKCQGDVVDGVVDACLVVFVVGGFQPGTDSISDIIEFNV